MHRMYQDYADSEVTYLNKKPIFPKTRNGRPTYIFMEDQLRHCDCGKGRAYWTGDAGTECSRSLKEIEERRLPWSRTYRCKEGGIDITVMRNDDERRKECLHMYMGLFQEFNDNRW